MLPISGILDFEGQGKSLHQYIIEGNDYYRDRWSEVLESPCHRGIKVLLSLRLLFCIAFLLCMNPIPLYC